MKQAFLMSDIISRTGAQIMIFASNAPTLEVLTALEGEGQVRTALGMYNSVTEVAYITPINALCEVMNSGLLKDQESVLFLSNEQKTGNRLAYLWYPETDTYEALGEFYQVTKEEAFNARGYTYMADTGLYFTTRLVPTQPAG